MDTSSSGQNKPDTLDNAPSRHVTFIEPKCCLLDLLSSETPDWEHARDVLAAAGTREKLDKLLKKSGNTICADCGSPDPKWVSSSIGVFICIKCSGVHRSLGVHISKVLSVKLDEWTDRDVNALANLGGNTAINEKYEARIPDTCIKPKPDSSIEERSDFIKRKYELLQFWESHDSMITPYKPPQKNASASVNIISASRSAKSRIGHAFLNSWVRKDSEHKTHKKSTSSAGMVEFVGLIMVNMVKGTNLVVRDVMSSDPYVILSLGEQSVKTRVKKNSLNPVWNESLMLSIPEHIPPLKVIVYDKDTFSTDDFMGQAEFDIEPLVEAAKAYETSTLNETMQLGKVVACKENNTLVTDSIITLNDGRVKQVIALKLQNVERGVLEIELECVPLTQ